MSLRSLKNDLDRQAQVLYAHITNAVDQHGLDPGADEVLDVIRNVFGDQVVSDFADWYAE